MRIADVRLLEKRAASQATGRPAPDPFAANTMNPHRRILLRGAGAATLLPLLGGGLLTPQQALAGRWNHAAFTAHALADAVKQAGPQRPAKAAIWSSPRRKSPRTAPKSKSKSPTNLANTRSLAFLPRKPDALETPS